MSARSLRRTAVAVVLLASLNACGGGGTGASPSASGGGGSYAGRTIQLGAVISQSGPGGIYAASQRNGINLAVDVINRNGGVNGATVAVDIEDDASDRQQSAQQFQTLIQAKQVLAIIGPTLSNQAVAAHPVADAAHTPVLAISNTGKGIVGQCPYDCSYIFRDSLGEATAIPANVKTIVASAHPHTAVILYANDDKFSSDGQQIFAKALADNGVVVANTVPFSKNETDFSSFVTTARGANPDLMVVSTLGGIASKIMIEARKQGYAGPFIGGNGFNTSAVSLQAGDAGKGAQAASAYYLGNSNAANKDFVTAYRSKYGSSPDQIAAQAYTGVVIIATAAKAAGLVFTDLAGDRTRLRDALAQVHIADTPLGPFSFTSDHDVRQPIYIVALDGKGGFTLVSTIRPS